MNAVTFMMINNCTNNQTATEIPEQELQMKGDYCGVLGQEVISGNWVRPAHTVRSKLLLFSSVLRILVFNLTILLRKNSKVQHKINYLLYTDTNTTKLVLFFSLKT